MAKAIMIQGTMSNAGKSLLCAGLCRIFHQDGYNVAPFKSQNMALNSYITQEGLEMGRAQVVQAEACGKEPDVRMNPVLLKPVSNMGSQVILNGEVIGNMSASTYYEKKHEFLPAIKQAYAELSAQNDILVIEGAGSPAEINLKQGDFVNMGMAKIANSPVILVGDIDRGGVFAQLYGTIALLEPNEQVLIKGCLINKFRGDVKLLENGLTMFENLAKKPIIGVLPYLDIDIDDEDSLSNTLNHTHPGLIDIAVIRLPRLANFTDFGALEAVNGISVRYIKHTNELKHPDLIIIPGTKNTIEDMLWLRQSGLESLIKRLVSDGTPLIGICGGYQMLGSKITDEVGAETGSNIVGMGLLPITTTFCNEKQRTRIGGKIIGSSGLLAKMHGVAVDGYEIHMGRTTLGNNATPWLQLESGDADGCCCGSVYGTYLHGFFDSTTCRQAILNCLATAKDIELTTVLVDYKAYKEAQYNQLADSVRKHCNIEAIYNILEEGL